MRSARARRSPHLQRCLPGAQGRRAPRRRGRTCRTRRSTFLKAVRPPYVGQCPRGLPLADQWVSARIPLHSAAPRPRPGQETAAPPARHPVGPRGSRGGSVGQPALFLPLRFPLPLSFPLPFTPFFSSRISLLPTQPRHLPSMAFPPSWSHWETLPPESLTRKTLCSTPRRGRVSHRTETENKCLRVCRRSGPEYPASAEIQNSEGARDFVRGSGKDC